MKYEHPIMEIIVLKTNDIIRTSDDLIVGGNEENFS